MGRIVFLDRDDALNEEIHYLHRREDLKLIPDVPQVLRLLKQAEYRLVVVTNQAGVTRGYYRKSDVEALHRYMNCVLEREGAAVDAYYYCPHHPEHGLGKYKIQCRCHEPGTGMSEMAGKDFKVGKAHSPIVGDKLLGAEAGRNYGIASIPMGTGYGREQHQKDVDRGVNPVYDHYGKTLMDAARWIVEKGQVWTHERDGISGGTDRKMSDA